MIETINKKTTVKKKSVALPLIPLRDVVVFPTMVLPLVVGRSRSISALNKALEEKGRKVIVSTQMVSEEDDPKPSQIYSTGTLIHVLQTMKLPDGTIRMLAEGIERVKILEYLSSDLICEVSYEQIKKRKTGTIRLKAFARSIIGLFEKYVSLTNHLPEEVMETTVRIEDPEQVSNTIAANLQVKIEDRQGLLEEINPEKRLLKIGEILNYEIQILKIEKRITGKIRRQIEESQKTYYLHEQLKAIEDELGKGDDKKDETAELANAIKQSKMTSEAEEKAFLELEKLTRMPPLSPESAVTRNYLDWLISLPWSKLSREKCNLKYVQMIMDRDHYGLEEPKKRILENLAVRRLAGKKAKSPILCLVGPPGVGKTSLAKSVAASIGRKFVRISLGGVRDEAEIRGHRRTYVGSLPGKIIQSIRKACVRNPVILLDEVDKLSKDFHGDPSSALLEVLDPEQNMAFNDHYLEVDFNLSEIMFIATANVIDYVHPTLLDRMEILEMPSYSEWEKLEIACRFLIPKISDSHGIDTKLLQFTRESILKIIRQYTREAGVRELERQLSKVFRKRARKIVELNQKRSITVRKSMVEKYLGRPKFRDNDLIEKESLGISTGLAWTESGGEILRVESSLVRGKGDLILTGQLGDIMQESARAALTFLRSRADEYGFREDDIKDLDIHVHVPEGAIPKDGPSAGVTIAASLFSSITKTLIRSDIAMTGEITLSGKLLPVGGIREKVLAAHRVNIHEVILPEVNRKDLEDIPQKVNKDMKYHFVKEFREIFKIITKKSKDKDYEGNT
ncbi:MAG: endopeptidase La [Candidatus Theseobacter exili]|nr:endopeptidase La [Candidatus Theseobacter exili]